MAEQGITRQIPNCYIVIIDHVSYNVMEGSQKHEYNPITLKPEQM